MIAPVTRPEVIAVRVFEQKHSTTMRIILINPHVVNYSLQPSLVRTNVRKTLSKIVVLTRIKSELFVDERSSGGRFFERLAVNSPVIFGLFQCRKYQCAY
ncbi:hypothetical protein FisN_15Hu027 [Fistulifera solaris]|uniref:Uncharacterized protein n=1 Tax=Fistulifera solaris TaxID=1519565 RepID=A0A1Z5KA80_FISSO|nr:hypothetical protein FisN_15Hu027 [Fistulifera solaris]|eukprot:GAX23072.1 hypothetical protein FisN_15Hu027 [Fistulifera solaris]